MSFFLLGKGPEGDLFLISDKVCASRQAALAELSSRTTDESFTHWDADVFVMNLEQGTPVLLVRPAAAAAAAEEQSPEQPAEEAIQDEEPAGEAEEPAEPAEGEAEPIEEVPAEPAEAEPAEAEPAEEDELAHVLSALEDETETLVVEEDEQPVVETTEPTVTEVEETIAEAVLADIEEPAEVEAEESEEIAEAQTAEAELASDETDVAEPADLTGGSLRDALMRTAASMHAEGIVPPESIGPAEPQAVDELQTPAEPEPDDEAAAESATDAAAGQAWPWDTPGAGSGAPIHHPDFKVHALDEPSYDDGPLVHASGDDATMAASRTVILGAYDEQPVEPEAATAEPAAPTPEPFQAPTAELPEEPASEALEAPTPEAAEEPAEEPAPIPSPQEVAAAEVPAPESGALHFVAEEAQTATPEEVDEAIEQLLDRAVENIEIPEVADLEDISVEPETPEVAPESDFIVDLPAPPSAASVPEGGYSGSGDTDDMSCNDCVYVETCPNKGQRDPRTCGSFQWK